MIQRGKPVLPGQTIGIVAPSAAVADDAIEKGLAVLHDLGYKTMLAPHCRQHWGYFAGTDEERARDIEWAFANEEIDGIVCLRGGYGATRLLPLLDYDLIKAHPKLFVGFSDITALHTAFLQRANLATIHGTMVMSLGRRPVPYTKEAFAQGLQEPYPTGTISLPRPGVLETIVPGEASGPLYGGNLMLLSAMTGTPYALDGKDGILLMEDVGEEAYALDRMLCQLEQSGLINRIKGIIFGEFARCEPTESTPYEFTVKEVVYEYAKRWGKPAVWGFPAGHGDNNAWLPLGVPFSLSLTDTTANVSYI